SELKELKLPYGVILSSIVFSSCPSLRSLTLPDNVCQNNGGFFFDKCEALTVTYKGNEYNYTNFNDLYNAIPYKAYTE
ncbi:MAG: hypothetical protein K2N71_03190, partial [Oscillospiraceae bacterium]|nr:hypothetical protein [Oscillospiraceae bacterium]